MIRLKCPKCATAMALDDAEAGGVGECTACGAKFRVPAAKAKVSARKVPDDDDEDDDDDDEEEERASRRPVRRRRDDDDDEEEKEELLTPEERDRLKLADRMYSDALIRNVKMFAALTLGCIVLFVAGLFINRVGWYVVGLGAATFLFCFLMVVSHAWRENPMWVLMLWLFGIVVLFVYIILYWRETKTYLPPAVAGVIIMLVGLASGLIYEGKKEARRAIIRERVKAIEGSELWRWRHPVDTRRNLA